MNGLPFDGDIKLSMADNGPIAIRSGQPDMDNGFSTSIMISLLTEPGWWGNDGEVEWQRIGSRFQVALNQSLSNKARIDILESVKESLSWIVSEQIADSVPVEATIPNPSTLILQIVIAEPTGRPVLYRYSLNWAQQKLELEAVA